MDTNGTTLHHEPPFIRIGLDPQADEEELYAVEQLMSLVGHQLYGDAYYHDSGKRIDARRNPHHKPNIDRSLVIRAWSLLQDKTWIGLQNVNGERKLRSLRPLEGLVKATVVSAGGNLIEDLEPLRGLSSLSTLYLTGNPVRDISPLADCPKLNKLDLQGTSVKDLSALQRLPELTELDADTETLETCTELSALKYLITSGSMVRARSLPNMPSLLSLDATLSSLDGLERHTKLQNLRISSSQDLDLGPLSALQKLTHVRIEAEASAIDLTPLRHTLALRELTVFAKTITGSEVLHDLPALREAHLVLPGTKYSEAAMLLSNDDWEAEFKAASAQSTPSQEIEFVTPAEFERFNTEESYGIEAWDGNRDMLSAERSWLLAQIEDALRLDFGEEDLVLPSNGGYRRSDTVCIYTQAAAEQLRAIITRIQDCLCWSRNPWIIYLQSSFFEGDLDAPDFIVWVYRDKVQTTHEYRQALKQWLDW